MRLTALTKFSESDLKPGEKIVLRVRRHWVSFALSMVRPFVILVFVTLLMIVSFYFEVMSFADDFVNLVLWGVFGVLYFYYIFVRMLNYWIDWKYDEDVVTTERIIDVDQNYLFGRDVGIAELDNIEDISVRHEGIFSTVFNYADIDIQTAGSNTTKIQGGRTFEMKDVPNPIQIQKIISEAVLAFREKKFRENKENN